MSPQQWFEYIFVYITIEKCAHLLKPNYKHTETINIHTYTHVHFLLRASFPSCMHTSYSNHITLPLINASYTQSHRVQGKAPVCVFFVPLTLDCEYTLSDSQCSFNIFHVMEDTMRLLCSLGERECVCVRERDCDITLRGLSACCCCLSLSCCLTIWLFWKEGRRQHRSKDGRKEGKV